MKINKEISAYIPNISVVEKIQNSFDSDFHSGTFREKEDFNTYLCALAYACLGTELFYDEKIKGKLGNEFLQDEKLMQGMLTYSVITKINKAKGIIDSLQFQKNKVVDFSKEDNENDYATIAFVMYYLTTKGYKVEWDKMSHAYTPINLEKGPVSFISSEKLNPNELLENVESVLNLEASL